MPAMNVDESSLRVDKNKQWIQVYCAGDITLKCLHRGRGLEAIDAIDIVPRYGGIIIHDCWASYFSYDHCGVQRLCVGSQYQTPATGNLQYSVKQ